MRILVIDDNVDVATAMRRFLELSGHEVHEAHTAADGIRIARQDPPNAVLCDIGLPGKMDGYALVQTLRCETAFANTLFIAITGDSSASRCDAIDSQRGFDFHFTKPVDLVTLEREILPRLGHVSH